MSQKTVTYKIIKELMFLASRFKETYSPRKNGFPSPMSTSATQSSLDNMKIATNDLVNYFNCQIKTPSPISKKKKTRLRMKMEMNP